MGEPIPVVPLELKEHAELEGKPEDVPETLLKPPKSLETPLKPPLETPLEPPETLIETEKLVEPKVIAEETVSTSTTGLSDLAEVDRLHITRRLKVKGVLFLRGKKNRFFVRTPDQSLVYTIEEENSWWVGYFCYGLRPLQLRVTNALGVEVMRISRPYAFTTRILPCQLQRLQVFSPPGHLIGNVQQKWSAVRPVYVITGKDGEVVFWIHGPLITLSCYNNIQFHIQRPDGSVVGATCKRWEGLWHALFMAPVTDRFGLKFDSELTLVEKALLLATSLLLDYMYYDV